MGCSVDSAGAGSDFFGAVLGDVSPSSAGRLHFERSIAGVRFVLGGKVGVGPEVPGGAAGAVVVLGAEGAAGMLTEVRLGPLLGDLTGIAGADAGGAWVAGINQTL